MHSNHLQSCDLLNAHICKSINLLLMASKKSKILIIGATGYLGKYLVKGSVSPGHLIYVFVRPLKPDTDSPMLHLHREFESMGVTIFQVSKSINM